ncbi:MAG: HD-GYP domain-containing protein [Bacillota bacterium]|nr:HD-GYP domain-containing protein [Bacillota bacterium]MDW7682943.1 HD-GYP domain-containing protein [Bacillota bacterium]
MSYKEEPAQAKLYIIFIVILGITFLFLNTPAISDLRLPVFFFLIVHIIMDHLEVPLPRGNGSVSVSFAIDLALIILFGPAVAAWVSFSSLFHKKTFKNFEQLFHKMLFNAAQLALCTGIAGMIYIRLGGNVGTMSLPGDIFPLAVAAFIYITLNSLIVMIVIMLAQKVSFWGVWLTNFRWAIPNYIATLPLGILIATVYANIGILGLLLLIVPLIVARHTFLMYIDMRNQYISTIKALTKAIDAKDHYTHGHSERVAEYAVQIGQEMKLPEDFVEKLEYLGLMHDIGKISIPEQILNKPSKLSDDEFDLVRSHSAVGAEIIQNIKFIGEHADIVRHHHERIDGRGYPDRLTGDKISLGAKIIGVADAFDAMTSHRIYSDPMSKKHAVEELERCSSAQFCKDVVNAFIKVLKRRGEI